MPKKQLSYDVLVLGAGPAGLFASIHAAAPGASTAVIDPNTMAGRKLLLTGAGRCNLTHAGPARDFLQAFGPQRKFLSYCLYEYPSEQIIAFFLERGLRTQVEETGCVFPATQRATAVRDILVKEARQFGVAFHYGRRVQTIKRSAHGFIVSTDQETFKARKIVLATGGLSYPQTGSSGDGYRFARDLGHEIVKPKPSLIPLITAQHWPGELAGTSIPDVRITARLSGRRETRSGGLIFIPNGIGGPAVLDLSCFLTDHLPSRGNPIPVFVDLLPTVPRDQLTKQLVTLCAEQPKKSILGLVAGLVPKRLARTICEFCACDDDLRACNLSKQKRQQLVEILKSLKLSIVETRPMAEATVTRGGVSIAQINPQTMESSCCPGLFFAGEIMDVDGPCGGYQLQMCWSTGALAGRSAGETWSAKS
jgi:predicted Rossmann fold flavoprotein